MIEGYNGTIDLVEKLSSGKIPIPYKFMEIINYSESKNLDILSIESYRQFIREGYTIEEITFIVKIRALSKKVYSKIENILNSEGTKTSRIDKGDNL
ncbi:MAG: hypothetical protein PHH98_05750 [Candidatus Gracilibacteria bacterium]|nr:hypothetical protein [Candidatus Gracilibacteria bacterium]